MVKLIVNLNSVPDREQNLIDFLVEYGFKYTIDSREENIEYINKVITKYGTTTCAELEADSSPCISCIHETSQLVEGFYENCALVCTYVGSIEVGSGYERYDELPDEVLKDIVVLMQQYESDNLVPD